MAERIELSEAQASLMATFRDAEHWAVRFLKDIRAHRRLESMGLLSSERLEGAWIQFKPTALGRLWLKEHGHDVKVGPRLSAHEKGASDV